MSEVKEEPGAEATKGGVVTVGHKKEWKRGGGSTGGRELVKSWGTSRRHTSHPSTHGNIDELEDAANMRVFS